MVIIYRASNEAEASIILHALHEAGIPATEGNSGSAAVFPIPSFGPTISVREQDIERGKQVIKQLETQAIVAEKEESYHDIDIKEINYLKEINEDKGSKYWFWILLLIAVLLGLLVSRDIFKPQPAASPKSSNQSGENLPVKILFY